MKKEMIEDGDFTEEEDREEKEWFSKYDSYACPKCPYYKKECDVQRLNNLPFPEELEDLFATDPYDIIPNEKYRKPKINTSDLQVPELPRVMFVSTTNFMSEETVNLHTLPKVHVNSTRISNVHNRARTDKVGLVLSAKEEMLLNFTQSENWTNAITKRGYDFVFAPTISFFFNQPSCATTNNRLLVYKSLKELAEAKIPTIPSLLYCWEKDAKEYAEWINKSGYNYVFDQFQMARREKDFLQGVEQLKVMKKYLNPKIKIILLGIVSIKRIKLIEETVGEFSYVNSAISILSSRRMIWHPKGEKYYKYDDRIQFSDQLFSENAKLFRETLSDIGVKC